MSVSANRHSSCTVPEQLYIDESGNYYRSDQFALRPGVYQLRIYCEDHEGMLYPTIGALESSYQALRCNGAIVFAHRREMQIEAYVVDKVENAYL